MGLTPRQLDAVAVEQPPRDTCVVAGPGSGKTTVLVEYFKRLVESGVDPLRILAITFTDKAANNMRDKLAQAFRERAAIRGKLDADNLTAGFVQVRVAGLLAVLTGNVAKKDASDRAEEIARSTRVTVDSDKPIVAGSVQNLIKVGAK